MDVGRTVTLTGILECVQRECRERVSHIRLLPFPDVRWLYCPS